MGPGASLDDLERKKSLAPAGIRTPDHPASRKVTMKMMKFDINMVSNLTEES